MTDPKTKKVLSHAYILGGSPCSGKSIIAQRLVGEFSLQCYKVDNFEKAHSSRIDPDNHPVMSNYAKMDWDERWMRPVEKQVEELFDYYRERFMLIAQDLRKFDQEKPIIVEGAAILPEVMEGNRVKRSRVIFLVPTKEFQIQHYRQRLWTRQILKECKYPEQAFVNWMMRDHLFGIEILQQAKKRNYKTMLIDGRFTIDQQYQRVKDCFNLSDSNDT